MNDDRKVVKQGPGYVLINPDQLDRNEPKNIHVLPANIVLYDDNSWGWTPRKPKTCCSIETKDGQLSCIGSKKYFKTESRALRNELARMQNEGTRICGNCAGHFYADYLDEEEAHGK